MHSVQRRLPALQRRENILIAYPLSALDSIRLLDDWRRLLDFPAENMSLEEIRQPGRQFVLEELRSWDREDLCGKY